MAVSALVLLAVFAVAGYLLTRPTFLIGQIVPVLEERLGGEVSIGSAAYAGALDIRLEDLRVRVRGHFADADPGREPLQTQCIASGDPGEVAHVTRATVRLSPLPLLRGRVVVRDVHVEGLRLRMSESRDEPGQFTFMALQPSAPPSPERIAPPRIVLRDAVIESGMHGGTEGDYRKLGEIRVAGSMEPEAQPPGAGAQPGGEGEHWYRFTLREITDEEVSVGGLPSRATSERDRDAEDAGLLIAGRWNAATHEHSAAIGSIRLDERIKNMCPQTVRRLWEHMALEGTLAAASVSWQPGSTPAIEVYIGGPAHPVSAAEPADAEAVGPRRESSRPVDASPAVLALTLPIQTTEDFWVRYRDGEIDARRGRPRMQVQSGSIALQGQWLRLENLTGRLIDGADEQEQGTSPRSRVATEGLSARSEIRDPRADGAPQTRRTAFGVPSREPLRGVPYTISLTVGELPELHWPQRERWLQQIVDTSPFTMNVKVDRFHLVANGEGAQPSGAGTQPGAEAVMLPPIVADSLQRFSITEGLLSSEITVERGLSERRSDGRLVAGRINTTGSLTLAQAAGAYNEFPYPLRDVAATLTFDSDGVEVDMTGVARGSRLLALGSPAPQAAPGGRAGARLEPATLPEVRLQGSIRWGEFTRSARSDVSKPHAERAAIDMTLHAENVPLERTLRSAMPAPAAAAFEALLHEPSYEAMKAAGLLDDPGPARAADAVSDLTPGFSPGGLLDLRMHIQRDAGSPDPALLTGTITLHWLGLLSEHLPYPLLIEDGTLLWDEDGVWISEEKGRPGLRVTTIDTDAAGRAGRGWVTGGLRFQRDADGRLRAEPDFHISLEGLPVGELLYAAIPPTHADRAALEEPADESAPAWPGRVRSEAAEALSALGIEGTLRVDGRVYTGEDGLDYAFVVRLDEARAHPSGDLANAIRAAGLVRPGEHPVIEDLAGTLLVSRDHVSLKGLSGVCGDSRVSARGRIDLAGAERAVEIHVEFESLELGEHLTEIMPEEQAARASHLLRHYQPQGMFDARLVYRTAHGEQQPPLIEIMPKSWSMHVDGTMVSLLMEEGSTIRISERRIELENVRGRLAAAADDGEAQARETRFAIDSGVIELDEFMRTHLDLQVTGDLTSDAAQAFLPPAVREALGELDFRDQGTSELAAALRLTRTGPDLDGWASAFRGTVRAEDASLRAGIELSAIDGEFDIDLAHEPGEPVELTIDARLARARALGQDLTNVVAEGVHFGRGSAVRGGEVAADRAGTAAAHQVVVPEIRAECHGGVVTARAMVGVGENAAYDAHVELAGVALQALTAQSPAELARAMGHPAGVSRVYAAMSLAGERGRPEQRSGRGTLRAMGGSIANIPVLLQIMQIMQLTPPLTGSLEHANVDFYIDGDSVVFERILLESTLGPWALLNLTGTGSMHLETLEIQAHLHSRSAIVLLRDLVGAVGDRLYAIELTGTLTKPRAGIVPLPWLLRPEYAGVAPTGSGSAAEHIAP